MNQRDQGRSTSHGVERLSEVNIHGKADLRIGCYRFSEEVCFSSVSYRKMTDMTDGKPYPSSHPSSTKPLKTKDLHSSMTDMTDKNRKHL